LTNVYTVIQHIKLKPVVVQNIQHGPLIMWLNKQVINRKPLQE